MTRYRQIAHELETLIAGRVLRAGERLPSVRKAQQQFSVSAGTILQAYGELEARGLVEVRPRAGYFVRAPIAAVTPLATTPRRGAARVEISKLVFEVLDSLKHSDIVPLGSAFPSPELFPLAALNRTAARMARQTGDRSSVIDLPPGNPELRRVIALRYLEAGCALSADDILITCGAMEALNLCLQAVTRPGDVVAIESPTFYATLQAIERLALKAEEIPTHPLEGIDLDALERALRTGRIKTCVLMPTLQNPLGSLMPEARRAQLARLLARFDVPLIEDDVYAELYFGKARPRPVKAHDSTGLVMHCGSFAKCLAPGYRVGWVAPGRFMRRVAQLKFMTTLSTASLPQAALAEFLKHGGYDTHLRRLRARLEQQHAALAQAVVSHFPRGTRMTNPPGGYLLWVELPCEVDALMLYRQARERGISIMPGPVFSARREYAHCIRLNFGYPFTAGIANAVAEVGRLAGQLCATPLRADAPAH